MKGVSVLYLIIFLGLLVFLSTFIFFYFFEYRITVQVIEEYSWNRYQDVFPQILASSINYGNRGNIPIQFILSKFVFKKEEKSTLEKFFNQTIGRCFEVEVNGEVFKNMEKCDVQRKIFEDKINLPLYINTTIPTFQTSKIVIRVYERKIGG